MLPCRRGMARRDFERLLADNGEYPESVASQ